MRVLYINNFLDGTGWSVAGINNILALDSVGIDVIPRAIKLNNVSGEIPKRISELMKKDLKGIDVVIQHVLPFINERNGYIDKNIILYATETSKTQWSNNINTMDEAWVINNHAAKASLKSGVDIPIRVVPHPTDITKFYRGYQPLDFGKNFIFYTLGEVHPRKNIETLIKAFHSEFDPDEPVDLLIKTTPMNGINSVDKLKEIIDNIKRNLFLYQDINKYKQEILIVEYWKEEMINRLHNTCDSFVCTSSGEAWSIPTFDAMGFGRSVICPSSTGFLDYMSEETGWMTPTRIEPMYGVPSAIENWYPVDINILRKQMREVYQNSEERKNRSIQGRKKAQEFSYEKIGSMMKEMLKWVN